MIQRKQSLWLLIAALLSAGVFCFDLYTYQAVVQTHKIVNAADVVTNTPAPGHLRVSDHFPTLLLAVVMTLLPLVTIFMFNNRKRQIRMSVVSMLAVISFVGAVLARVSGLKSMTPPATDGSYWVGSVLPAIALVFLIMAVAGIRKDEKLVKSADRLR